MAAMFRVKIFLASFTHEINLIPAIVREIPGGFISLVINRHHMKIAKTDPLFT